MIKTRNKHFAEMRTEYIQHLEKTAEHNEKVIDALLFMLIHEEGYDMQTVVSRASRLMGRDSSEAAEQLSGVDESNIIHLNKYIK